MVAEPREHVYLDASRMVGPLAPSHQRFNVKPAAILVTVADVFGVSVADLTGKSREHEYAQPRMIAVNLMRELTPLSLGQIGRYLGGRDHTTVMYSVEQRDRLLSETWIAASYCDAYQSLTGERPDLPQPDDFWSYQGVPVEIVVNGPRSTIRFVGTPPIRFDQVMVVNRDQLRPPPRYGSVTDCLYRHQAWLLPLVKAGRATPEQQLQLSRIKAAIRALGGAL